MTVVVGENKTKSLALLRAWFIRCFCDTSVPCGVPTTECLSSGKWL